MAKKEDFTPEEWNKLLQSVVLTGMAVSAADPNGLWGTIKEAAAGRAAIAASKRDANINELIKAVIADFEAPKSRQAILESLHRCVAGCQPAEVVQRSLETLREVSVILDTKAPQNANAFKDWLRVVGQKVAEASKEGSIAGFGGVKISDAETATLADISKALNSPA